ncbi:peptidoglycan-binding protein [Leptolyngbya sp. FACHB-36]|uniref:peptidoglycan-binding domain-containing protein n=1 Tax=Leptolyngbya sp. FACHB-36 TaxID=2692808 RepID=UPI0016802188|nr:peptidoglycan-binding protein [Leptolyngbya sp. FACHB-36]MBD2019894.1 peptidoglycan-binding protein [Leptolyngbya sp. FACHB-36]
MSEHPRLSEAALIGPVVRPWDTGAAVAEVQELLQAHGFDLRVDGSYGWITETAVMSYQREHGCRIDGVVGPKTWAALKASVKAGTRTLRQGHSGFDVFELQGLLQIHGYPVPRDGIFAKETKQAVTTFQEKHRLRCSGIVDSTTWTALRGRPLSQSSPRQRWLLDPRKWW